MYGIAFVVNQKLKKRFTNWAKGMTEFQFYN